MSGSLSEQLRLRYRPARVRLLLIGESPPSSGRFFYNADSGLYRATRQAFQAADPSLPDDKFLERFQAAGCYLIDLCPMPVDRLDAAVRREACREAEPALRQALHDLRPELAATVVRSIRPNVVRAGWEVSGERPLIDLPYPGRWVRHREVFVEQLSRALRENRIV